MRDVDLTSKDIERLGHVTELMDREWSPCRYYCPVHADVRSYIEATAEGRFRDAIDIIRENLPFAAVCGRVCHHPCELNCRRKDVDDPVGIREVKRFVAEIQGANGSTVHKAPAQDKGSVGIIGAGPAGLSAALDLAKLGYRPTVFEKFDIAGGIPVTAIPRYRLPSDVVQIDIDWICAHGVELKTGVEIGRDKNIKELLDEHFEAVLLAVGLSDSRPLPIPGADHQDVHLVLDFLQALNLGAAPQVGNNVLVIGGGNVACDAARSAVRLGTKRVRMMCLENEEEMPAWDWERLEAVEEGIEIIHRRGPVEVKIDSGRIARVPARKVTRVFDENSRFNPQYDDTDVIDVECDTVIIAIGQMGDMGFIEGSGLKLDTRGGLEYNPDTHQTSSPKVFACGEIITPPGAVVDACASGQRAAKAIDMYLSGRDIRIDDSLPPYIETITPETGEKVLKVSRTPVPTAAPEHRRGNFVSFEETYEESASLREARRCMNCGSGAEVLVDKCAACLTCLRVCPFDIPKVTDVARIESVLCQACGMCIAECPANAIIARGRDVGDLVARTAAVLGDGRRIVTYICGHHAAAADWRGENELPPGMAEIYLPSTARLSAAELLHAFENGADAVFVVSCSDGAERYPQTAERTRRRVVQARRLLAEVGLDPDSLRLFELGDQDRSAIHTALTEAGETLAAS